MFSAGDADASRQPSERHRTPDRPRPHVGAPIDANGNLTSDSTRTFEWDARNQLVAITEGSQRADYSYDGIGRRVRVRTLTGGVETGDSQYVWCDGVIREERMGGAVSTRFYSSGVQRSGSAYYHVHDHLTSIREITNASAASIGQETPAVGPPG
jgi:YD repeat-containing protein